MSDVKHIRPVYCNTLDTSPNDGNSFGRPTSSKYAAKSSVTWPCHSVICCGFICILFTRQSSIQILCTFEWETFQQLVAVSGPAQANETNYNISEGVF